MKAPLLAIIVGVLNALTTEPPPPQMEMKAGEIMIMPLENGDVLILEIKKVVKPEKLDEELEKLIPTTPLPINLA